MKKKKIIIFLLILSAVIGSVMKYRSHSVSPEPDAIWVQAITVKPTPLTLEARAIGTLVAARNVEIKPDVAEHVDKIFFQDGAFVKEGTVLFQLDDTEYKAKVASAKAKLDYSEGDFKRLTLLAKKSYFSKRDLDKAEADLKGNRADVQQMETTLNKMKITAPFDGVVGKSKVNLGDYATIGTSIVTLTDTKHLRIEYNIPEKYLAALKLKQEVKITTVAYPGKIFVGKVAFISPTIDSDNRSISLYADVPNDNDLLKAGMLVTVVQSLGTEAEAIMIPARSLIPMLDTEQVYKILDGKAATTTVVIGKREAENVEITQGLSPGDVVITDGQLKVKNGVPVKVKN